MPPAYVARPPCLRIDLVDEVVPEGTFGRDDQLDILPLVQNLALPSPATGWWNRECPAFVDRADRQSVGDTGRILYWFERSR